MSLPVPAGCTRTPISEFELIEIERALDGCESLKDMRALVLAGAEERDRATLIEMFGDDFYGLDVVLRGVPRLIAALRSKA